MPASRGDAAAMDQAGAMDLLIRKFEARDRLTQAEKQALQACPVRIGSSSAGHDIVSAMREVTESCLVLDGFAARYNLLSGGERQITAIHVPGDFVDLHSLLLEPVDHSVVALTPCKCAYFPHSCLRKITEEWPHLTRMLWLSTLIDSAIHRQWLVAMGRRSSAGHLAHLICELFLRLEVVGLTSGKSFRFPVTQNDIADAMGLSVVHLNRVLRELRLLKLVTWQGGIVRIDNWEGLKEKAEFDPAFLNLTPRPR
jgi:CRP-like cAMP-binding protein